MSDSKDFFSLNGIDSDSAYKITIGARGAGKLFFFEQLCIEQREEINRQKLVIEELTRHHKLTLADLEEAHIDIKEKAAEIESLSIALEVTRDNLGDTREELNKLETEIERLKNKLNEEKSENDRLSFNISNLEYDYELLRQERRAVKAEAVKEFAERLEAEEGVPMNTVDRIKKEMVGE